MNSIKNRNNGVVSRGRQLGLADQVPLFLIIFVYGYFFAIGFSLIASVVGSFFIFKGKARMAALIAVISFWIFLYYQKIYIPQKEGNIKEAIFDEVRGICNYEINNIPELIEVEGFLDEGAALRTRSLLKLLSERALKFIEIKVKTVDGQQVIAYPDGSSKSMWRVSRVPGSYVRIELGEKGDPNCISSPYDREIDRPPFLPNTCLKMTFPESSQAKFVLKLETIHPKGENFGYWVLIDRNNEKRLAALTTFIKHGKDWSNGGEYINVSHIASLKEKRLNNCFVPHTVLSDRLIGIEKQWTETSKVLDQEKIIAKIKPEEINKLEDLIEVRASEKAFFYAESEHHALFSPESEYDAWEIAVGDAKKKGWSNLGTIFLNWKNHQLISLIPVAENNSYPWQSQAFGQGFFVFSTGRPWQDRDKPRKGNESNILIRYSNEGDFLWAVRILPPANAPVDPKCSFTPKSIAADQENIIFLDGCTKLYGDQIKISGKDNSGLMWRIPIKNLPALIN